jgi:hypothetical protein
VLTLSEGDLPEPAAIAAELRSLIGGTSYDEHAVERADFTSYTARESTRLLAAALDEALTRASARKDGRT